MPQKLYNGAKESASSPAAPTIGLMAAEGQFGLPLPSTPPTSTPHLTWAKPALLLPADLQKGSNPSKLTRHRPGETPIARSASEPGITAPVWQRHPLSCP